MVRNNFIVRGGYGVYYDQTLVGIVEQNAFVNPPFANTDELVTGTVANADHSTGIRKSGAAAATSVGPAQLFKRRAFPFITPIVQQWNLTLQRQIGQDGGDSKWVTRARLAITSCGR